MALDGPWQDVKVMFNVIVEVVLREAINEYTYHVFVMEHQSIGNQIWRKSCAIVATY